MPATPLPLTPTPLETQIAKLDVNCGGLTVQQAVNLIGQLLGTLYSPDSGSIIVSVGGSSFVIPTFDSQTFTYVGGGAADDDLVQTIVFKNGATTVGTLTFVYFGATNNIQSITLT